MKLNRPIRRVAFVGFAGALCVWLAFADVQRSQAAATNSQKKQIEDLTGRLQKAGQMFIDQKFKEAAKEVESIQRGFNKLAESTDPEVVALLEPLYNRLIKAHAKLELEGFDFPKLKKPEAGEAMPVARKGAKGPAAKAGTTSVGGIVSFTKQVAPLLVTKCGRCHVDAARGEFSMASYAQLMKGSSAGTVIFPGDDQGSRLIEIIESGDMPRGGGKLAAEEFSMLKKWIKDGAKFDGQNETASLKSLAPGAKPAEPQMLAVTKSTGMETVSFAKDIAPVLAANCNGCHVDAQRARGNFNMTTFAGLLRGGDSGTPIKPGNAADSLLIKRIKGEGGDPRMPMGRAPLADSVIAKFEKWIAEGATYDAGDSNLNVGTVAALAKAQASSHEELTAERGRLAEQNWHLGLPNVKFNKTDTDNFLLLGNVSEAMLKDVGKKIEAIQPRIAALFNIPTDQPMIKGRMTIFVFGQRYDYAEFGQMVEKRQLPAEWRGHWRFTIVDAYGAMIPPREDEYSFDALVGHQIAGAYVASLGRNVPRWFAEGSARVMASRIAPKDPRVMGWENELSGALGSMSKPDDFLTGKLAPEHADVAAYSFAKFLMKNNGLYNALLNALRSGQDFDKAFVETFKGTPAQVAQYWIPAAAKSLKKKR